ncbi:MAG: DNA-directed RNA polymerase subunit alpha [Candidatus Magasanikbacteria bacterium]|jgi:DNA-directed RNA polymerase subunit alpha|nr:DNA-directed RNA polymerase subunit alpha [Candidatus Magasanikbacteria bacterium]
MEHILLPTTIEFQETDQKNVSQLIVSPCEKGYGTTLGNALRRVLLASLPGAAVESVRIDGVQHEFGAIDGVQEDMVEVILNLKQLAVISHAEEPVLLKLSKKGLGPVTAADFKDNADIELVNKDLHLLTLTDDGKALEMEVIIGKGLGYVPVKEKEAKNVDLGTILIDSLYTPIRDLGYAVENTRVGDVTDFEKLTMTIETNGTLAVKEAVKQGTKILMDHFAVILAEAERGTGTSAVASAEDSE